MRAAVTSMPPACSCGEAAAFGRVALACLAAAAVLAVPGVAQASTDTTFDAENRQFGLTPVRGVRLNRAKENTPNPSGKCCRRLHGPAQDTECPNVPCGRRACLPMRAKARSLELPEEPCHVECGFEIVRSRPDGRPQRFLHRGNHAFGQEQEGRNPVPGRRHCDAPRER